MAISGLSAGANAMKPVSFSPSLPVSAVPVLPATSMPEICAAVAVPASTTATIIGVRAAAVDAFITRRISSGRVREITFPSGATMRSTTCGSMRTPPFAIVATTIAIWSGVTSSRSWPKASRPGSIWFGSSGSKSRPFDHRPLGVRSSSGVSSGGSS